MSVPKGYPATLEELERKRAAEFIRFHPTVKKLGIASLLALSDAVYAELARRRVELERS